MKRSESRRIWVEFVHEPELWEQQGKYVRLDGRTYIVKGLKISGDEPIAVDLLESLVPEGETAKAIEHWMRRGR